MSPLEHVPQNILLLVVAVFGTAYHNKINRKVNAVDPLHGMAFEPLVCPNWTVKFVKDDEQWTQNIAQASKHVTAD